MLKSAMDYLAAADATAMAAETQARCLQALEQLTSVGTAARTSILAAFTSGKGYSADADYSPRAWLIHKTHVTPGAAVAYTAWVRRAAAHPEIAVALAAGKISESVARTICSWTDKLPQDCQEDADAILLGAAAGGADLRDLAMLAGEIYGRSLPKDKDKDQDDGKDEDEDEAFDDRSVRLETTFQGAGVVHGDLTPECASTSARCWMRCPRRPARRTPARKSSGATTRCRRRCSGWSPPGCCRAGRAAGQSLGAYLAGRPDDAGRQLGPAGGVDQPGPGAVGGAPGAGLGRRRCGRGVAGRGRRSGGHL